MKQKNYELERIKRKILLAINNELAPLLIQKQKNPRINFGYYKLIRIKEAVIEAFE